MIAPRCLIRAEAWATSFPECFADSPKWFHGRRVESTRAHTADKGLEPAASTRWVLLLLLLGPAIGGLSLSGRWFRGATVPSGRENRAAHRRSHRL